MIYIKIADTPFKLLSFIYGICRYSKSTDTLRITYYYNAIARSIVLLFGHAVNEIFELRK